MPFVPRARFTLSQVLVAGIVGLGLVLAAFFSLLLNRSRDAILQSSARLSEHAGWRAASVLDEHLKRAESVGRNVVRQVALGSCVVDSPRAVEPCLTAQLLENDELTEVTLTRADKLDETDDGVTFAAPGRWQLAAERERARPGPEPLAVCTRTTQPSGTGFVAVLRCGDGVSQQTVPDPTTHATFTTPAEARFTGKTIWSDLSYSGLDAHLPVRDRRVVVNVLTPLYRLDGHFLGVLRVSMLERALDDELLRLKVNEADAHDPFRVFLTDETGRLVTRLSGADELVEDHDDLRVAPGLLAPELKAALALPILAQLDSEHPFLSTRFFHGSRGYFASFRALERTQGWRVAIVGPEDYYLDELRGARRWLLISALILVALVVAGSLLALRSIRGGFRRIEVEANHMREFSFAPTTVRASFRDVEGVLDSLERAKTALRALGKYVPIDLVRQLYDDNREPELGGTMRDLSLMFTDIQGFTTLSERLPIDRLAQVFGLYIEAITAGIHDHHGTVDKYIGDGVMALWNAPEPLDHHAVAACRAALACVDRAAALFASPAWEGMPPLVTRFGLHRGEVMVGNFGAPDRMNFTALGDGVNLAARLEGLNKVYGTTIMVSESVWSEAKDAFCFRRLDRVAVKGKAHGVLVYELIGPAGASGPRVDAARRYEAALDAHHRQDFAAALLILAENLDDPPSRMLAERCRTLAASPPPPDWDGVYIATSK